VVNPKDVADNIWLMIVSRLAIFVVTFMVLPIVGWLLVRMVSTGDTMLTQLQLIEVRLTSLDGQGKLISEEIQHLRASEDDHEARIRRLEQGSKQN
jgi:hypothetical protein